jgi:hypothetical protein
MTEPKGKWCIFRVGCPKTELWVKALVGGRALADSDLKDQSPWTLDILTVAAALSHRVILGKITSVLIPG